MDGAVDLHDLNEFFRLSAILNLQLSARAVGKQNIVSIILGGRRMPPKDQEILIRVLQYLDNAYGETRRRLGPFAVLHPIRATALLARSTPEPGMLDLLTEMLHDKLEDLTAASMGDEHFNRMEGEFRALLHDIDPKDEWYLMERLDWLTRRPDQTYLQYIGNLLDRSHQTPALIRVKLADRLDNTLDMRIDIEDPIAGVDFFATLFQVLFVNNFPGYRSDLPHPPSSPLNGAQRLYQLFKNAVVLSLMRQKDVGKGDPAAMAMFNALAVASMKEAQRTILHIFAFHETDVRKQRELIMDAMGYVQAGGVDHVTPPGHGRMLDGLFLSRFEDTSPQDRKQRLDALYCDKPLMVEAAIAFIVIFLSFLSDEKYFVRGVGAQGIVPD